MVSYTMRSVSSTDLTSLASHVVHRPLHEGCMRVYLSGLADVLEEGALLSDLVRATYFRGGGTGNQSLCDRRLSIYTVLDTCQLIQAPIALDMMEFSTVPLFSSKSMSGFWTFWNVMELGPLGTVDANKEPSTSSTVRENAAWGRSARIT